MTTIAFIGLGAMGSAMAANLRGAGFALRVWSRDRAKCTAFARDGGVVCDSAAHAAAGADFVVSMVADDHATRAVMLGDQGVLTTARRDAVIVDCSTNTPAMVREVAAAAAAHGVLHLDAPVSGSIPQARGRELVFMVGGDAAVFERARPLFDAMGRMARLMGGSGAGATIKLITAGGKSAMDLAACIYLVVVVALASITYRFIEMPARERFNGWGTSLARQDRVQQTRPPSPDLA